jgi:predicted DNA-binding transcriptional regulator AlpA
MNRAEIDDLPAVVDVCTAAKVLGLSRTAAYELIRVGEWPTPVFRLGKLIRIPTAPMRELLGIDSTIASGADSGSPDKHRSAG